MPNGFWLTVLIVLSALLVLSGMRARRIRSIGMRIAAMALLAIASISALSASVMAIAGIIKANSRTAPIPTVHIIGNREQIERGAQIADSFCGACHSQSGPLTGGMDIGKDLAVPVGSFVSSNLTPTGLLSHWTDGEIFRAIRNGVDAQGNWLTIMSYTNVSHLSDTDIEALIAYLRSRAPAGAPTANPPDHFNLLGLMMLGAGMLPSGAPVLTGTIEAPPPSATVEYGSYILSFQDVRGGLVFPMRGTSLHWFVDLFTQVRTGDVKGAFSRSIRLAVVVTVVTVVISFMAGLAFRRRFAGDSVIFYLMIGSLVAPGLVLGIGVGLICNVLGIETSWYTTALGAQLSWTLPFGVLVMFAVMSRFDNAWDEAARDLGASAWQTIYLVIIPVLAPGLVAVALFGFTLSYDEFTRTLLTAGSLNTLPLEIWSMTLNVTSPSLYALGTVTTLISFLIIGVCLGTIARIQKRRAAGPAAH